MLMLLKDMFFDKALAVAVDRLDISKKKICLKFETSTHTCLLLNEI